MQINSELPRHHNLYAEHIHTPLNFVNANIRNTVLEQILQVYKHKHCAIFFLICSASSKSPCREISPGTQCQEIAFIFR